MLISRRGRQFDSLEGATFASLEMTSMKTASFGPFALSHLERNLHQMLIISRVVCKVCLL